MYAINDLLKYRIDLWKKDTIEIVMISWLYVIFSTEFYAKKLIYLNLQSSHLEM